MHDPHTLVARIYCPWSYLRKETWKRTVLFEIWHKDPCKTGPWRSDDSCGWFIRSGHCDPKILAYLCKDFAFDWYRDPYNGWFDKNNKPVVSYIHITIGMFRQAAYRYYGSKSWQKADSFVQRNLLEIINFAESTIDGLFPLLYDEHYTREDYIERCVNIIYPYVVRLERPWYKHPKWHIHHWEVTFIPYSKIKQRFIKKCCFCGKRGSKTPWYTDWNGTKVWHEECNERYNKFNRKSQ